MDRSIELSKNSDLIIAIFDRSRDLTDEDKKILELIDKKKSIIILNKSDLSTKFSKEDLKIDVPIIEASIKNKSGIKELEDIIVNIFETDDINYESTIITNIRHERLLKSAKEKLESSLKDIKNNIPIDCVEVDLRSSYADLGEITGDSVSDEILDKVFKEFCVGK